MKMAVQFLGVPGKRCLLPPIKAKNTGREEFIHRYYAALGDFQLDVYHSYEYKKRTFRDRRTGLMPTGLSGIMYLSELLRKIAPARQTMATNFDSLKTKHLAGAWGWRLRWKWKWNKRTHRSDPYSRRRRSVIFSEYGDCLAIDEEVTLQPATEETFDPPERLVVCARQSHSHA
jgi:hypothetical protein